MKRILKIIAESYREYGPWEATKAVPVALVVYGLIKARDRLTNYLSRNWGF